MKVHVKHILWDTDGSDIPKLPHTVTIDIDIVSDINIETADYLSDEYGYDVIAFTAIPA